MSTSVKERIKTELEQAQAEGKQRAGRIGDILRAAASMTFEELKAGSSEVNAATRKSVAELLEELQEPADSAANEVAELNASATADNIPEVGDEQSAEEKIAPTWKSLLRNTWLLVRDRKGDWFHAFKENVNHNAVKFDQDMTDEYGDRYLKVRDFFQRVVEQIKSPDNSTAQTTNASDSQPVTIEVVDGDDAVVDVTPTVQVLEPEAHR